MKLSDFDGISNRILLCDAIRESLVPFNDTTARVLKTTELLADMILDIREMRGPRVLDFGDGKKLFYTGETPEAPLQHNKPEGTELFAVIFILGFFALAFAAHYFSGPWFS